MAGTVVLGLPGIEAEENFEEDSHRPLISGAENEDEYEANYSIQEGGTVTHIQAISFHQACCLPGVIPVRIARPGALQLVRCGGPDANSARGDVLSGDALLFGT